MQNEVEVLGVLAGANEDEVIEVVLRRDQPGEQIQLRFRQWGSGVGWYTQKSVDIDASQIGRLIQALNRVPKTKRPTSPSQGDEPRSVVVPFRRFA